MNLRSAHASKSDRTWLGKSLLRTMALLLAVLVSGCGLENIPSLGEGLDAALDPKDHLFVVTASRGSAGCIDNTYVQSLQLSRETTVHGLRFPAGSNLYFQKPLGCSEQDFRSVKTVEMPIARTIDIEILSGTRPIPCTGKIEFAVLLRRATSCQAARSIVWGGKTVAAGDRVVFAFLLKKS